MRSKKQPQYWILIALAYSVSVFAQAPIRSIGHRPKPADESILRKLTAEYFTSISKNAWDNVKNLTRDNPEMVERRESLQKSFGKAKRVQLTELTINSVIVYRTDSPKFKEITAGVDVRVVMEALDDAGRPTGLPFNAHRILWWEKGAQFAVYPQTERDLEFVDRVGIWKIQHDWPDDKEILKTLTTPISDEKVRAILLLETQVGARRIVQALEEKAIERVLHDDLAWGFRYFSTAKRFEVEVANKQAGRIRQHNQDRLYEAEQKLITWRNGAKSPTGRPEGVPFTPWDNEFTYLRQVGDEYYRLANYDRALQYYFEAMDHRDQEPQLAWELHDLTQKIGDIYARKSNYSLAREKYLESIKQYEASGITTHGFEFEAVRDLRRAGDLTVLEGNYTRAIEYYEMSIQELERLLQNDKDKRNWAISSDRFLDQLKESVRSVTDLYYWQNDFDSLLRFHERNTGRFVALGFIEQGLDSLGSTVTVHFERGNYHAAIIDLRRLIDLAERNRPLLKDPEGTLAEAEMEIGLLQFALGNNDQAFEYLARIEDRVPRLSDRTDLAIYQNLIPAFMALVQASQGGDSLADGLKRDAPGTTIDTGAIIFYSQRVVSAVVRLGDSLRLHGSLDKAWECYQYAFSMADDETERLLLRNRFRVIGETFHRNGNDENALSAYEAALKIANAGNCTDKICPEDYYWFTDNVNYDSSFEWEFRDPLLEEALRRSRESKWRHYAGDPESREQLLLEIGEINISQGHYSQGLKALRGSLTTNYNPYALQRSLLLIAETYLSQGEYHQAISFAERAVQSTLESRNPFASFKANIYLGKACRAVGARDRAEQAFKEAINTVETIRSHTAGSAEDRQFFFDEKLEPYHELIGILLSKGMSRAALDMAETTKSRVLLEVLSSRVREEDLLTPGEREKAGSLQTRVTQLRNQLKGEADQIRGDRLQTELRKAVFESDVFRMRTYARQNSAVRQQPQTKTSSVQIENLLTHSNAVLEYVVADDQTYLFVATKENGDRVIVHSYILPITKTALNDRVSRFRELIEKRSNNFRAAARELYDSLITVAESDVSHKPNLVIIPDGPLWKVPFQALLTANQHYLIEESAVSYASSLRTLSEMTTKASDSKSGGTNLSFEPLLLAIGNPVTSSHKPRTQPARPCGERNDLGAIPESEREVNEISKLYGGNQTGSRVLLRADATAETFKKEAPNFQILHVATHGILDDKDPMNSHLVFSKSQNQDSGSLAARDMMTLRLNANLVVLSACETGQGRVGDGEGMIGMAWALAAAGAPTIIASQWSINSCSTADLMIDFHRRFKDRILKGDRNISPAEALRQASLALMKRDEYQHPFYWAGFVVIGAN